MRAFVPGLIAAAIAVPAAAQQGGLQAQSPSPSIGSANLPAANLGMDSFSGAPMRSGDHGPSSAEYRARAEQNRAEAKAWADRAKQGPIAESYAAQIRDHLKNDLVDWREGYSVRGADYRAMVQQWLVDTDKLNAVQWAQQRAAWFDARDAWIAAHGGKR